MSVENPVIVIASPFETEFVARMIEVAGVRATVVHRLDLLPPATYPADHDGPDDFVRSAEDQAQWLGVLASADVFFGSPREKSTNLLEIAPDLKWLQGTSSGMGKYAERNGLIDTDVIVTTASGVHGGALSEFVFAALLGQSRNLGQLAEWQRAHHWQRFTADELAGKTMTIIGPGRIGRQIARVAKAFDMQVVAVGRTGGSERATELGVDRYLTTNQLTEALAGADVLVITSPHTGSTDHLIGEAEFAVMKRGATIVNIGRGAVVDEQVLIRQLRDGSIGFAALDVFEVEPLPVDSPLWDMPNVLISPHCSANAPKENERILEIFLRNLPLFLDGRLDEMSPVLDKGQLY